MCGRYGYTDPKQFKSRYDLKDEVKLEPNFNAAPSMIMPVVIRNGSNHLELMRWGLIPHWAKDLSIGAKMINARSEGIEDKPSFKQPLRSRRCLVPVNYFFEWQKTKEGSFPFLIKMKDDSIFSLAGLFDIVKDAEGNEIKSYTIITTESNELMSEIHERMPVILKAQDEIEWLDPKVTDIKSVIKLLKPHLSEEMASYRVSRLVNNPNENNAEIIRPES